MSGRGDLLHQGVGKHFVHGRALVLGFLSVVAAFLAGKPCIRFDDEPQQAFHYAVSRYYLTTFRFVTLASVELLSNTFECNHNPIGNNAIATRPKNTDSVRRGHAAAAARWHRRLPQHSRVLR
jgi:hypothetical protein